MVDVSILQHPLILAPFEVLTHFLCSVFRNTLDASAPDVMAELFVPRAMDPKAVREQVLSSAV